MRAIRILIAGLIAATAAWQAAAHNPHDPVFGLGISPEFLGDRTLFMAGPSEVNWGYPDLLRSIDGGASWQKVVKGIENRGRFVAVRVSPNFARDRTVLAASNAEGIFVSTDGGTSWRADNAGLPYQNKVVRFVVGATSTDGFAVFAVMQTGAVYRRLSTERTWRTVWYKGSGIATTIALAPDYASSPTVVLVDGTGRVHVSTDGGSRWQPRANPTSGVTYDLAIAPGNPSEIFLAGGTLGLLRSTDGGATFAHITSNLPAEPVNRVALSPEYARDGTVFCTTFTQAAFRSFNRGASWVFSPSGAHVTGQTAPENEFSEIQFSPGFAVDRTVILSTYDGAFISRDGGATWRVGQFRKELITGIAFSPYFGVDQTLMVTSYNGIGIFRSTDAGANWVSARGNWPLENSNLSAFEILAAAPGPNGLPTIVVTRNRGAIGATANFGAYWQVSDVPPLPDSPGKLVYPTALALSPGFGTDATLLMGTRAHGVLKSSDGGATWSRSTGLPATRQVTSVAVSPAFASDRTAFAGNLVGAAYRSTDGGRTWAQVGGAWFAPLPRESLVGMAVSPDFANDGTVLAARGDGLYVSLNRGESWAKVALGAVGSIFVTQQVAFAPGFATNREVYLAVRGRGLYRLVLDRSGVATSVTDITGALLDQGVQFVEFALSPAFGQDGVIVGASRTAVYRTRDRGATWDYAGAVRR